MPHIKRYRAAALAAAVWVMAAAQAGCAGPAGPSRSTPGDPAAGLSELNPLELPLDESTGWQVAAENEGYRLCLDFATTQFSLEDKAASHIWYSNPFREAPDAVASDEETSRMQSNMVLYYNNKRVTESIYTTQADSVAYDQFKVYGMDGGFRVVYTVGKDKTQEIYPPVLDVETFRSIEESLGETQRDRLNTYYVLIESKELLEGDSSRYADKKQLLETYPALKTTDLYVLSDLTVYQRRQLKAIIEEVGFTYEEMVEQAEAAGYVFGDDSVLFTVPLDVVLCDGGFRASVDTSLITGTDGYVLNRIGLLYGMAATTEEGEILVPDGSGAVIPTPGTGSGEYNERVYGPDEALSYTVGQESKSQIVLPFVAVSTGRRSVLAAVEQGESMAFIRAKPAMETDPFAAAHVEFIVNDRDYRETDSLVMEGARILLNSKKAADGEFSVRYFLGRPSMSYSDLAVQYRSYLRERGALPQKGSDGLPFVLDLFGSADKTVYIAGIPIERRQALTTFDQAQTLLESLKTAGVEEIRVRYLGMLAGGLANKAPRKLDGESVLGGSGGYRDLLEYAQERGIRVYPDAAFNYVYKDGPLDGFVAQRDAARRINGQSVYTSQRSPATWFTSGGLPYYAVSPGAVRRYAESLKADMDKKRYDTISLSTLGKRLNSDFREENAVLRTEAQEIYSAIAGGFSDGGYGIMLDTANQYLLKYADIVVNLPTSGSQFHYEKCSVPFVQLVLHGSVDYAMAPFNASGDTRREVLRAVEAGGLPYYQWMWADNTALKNTAFEKQYSLSYTAWIGRAIADYETVRQALEPVRGVYMASHRYITDGISETAYENGVRIVVNYTDREYAAEEYRVAPQDYIVLGGGDAS